MRIVLLTSDLGNPTSGPSRFVLNLSRGLNQLDIDLDVVADSAGPAARAVLKRAEIPLEVVHEKGPSSRSQAAKVWRGTNRARAVGRLARSRPRPDWFVVLSDDMVEAVGELPGDRAAFLCNGDYALLFLSPPFYRSQATAKKLFSLGVADLVMRHATAAKRYAMRIGNCEFTRQFMSFVYGVPFQGAVFPPVDLEVFRPRPSPGDDRYAVALARNDHEQGLEILADIATRIPLRIVGGAKVEHAASLGVIADDQLAALLSGAQFLAFPATAEFFGYAVAESLACGTPVLAFDSGGPAELIRHNASGWLVRESAQFASKAEQLFTDGYDPGMRTEARKSSERYALSASAAGLLDLLSRSPDARPPSRLPSSVASTAAQRL